MARLRVGVIGCGLIAQVMHLPHLRELDDRFEIAALCDLSRQVLDAVGAYYGVTRRCTDWRELVALPDVDAVLVCTTGSHAPQAIAAAEAGKHVLVEKPMCLTLREADAMVAAAERSGVTLMVAYMKRYDPGYRYAHEIVRGLHDVRYVQVNVLHPAEPPNYAHHRLHRSSDVDAATVGRLQEESRALVRESIGDVPEHVVRNYLEVLTGSVIHDINALGGLFGPPDEVLFTELWDAGQALTTTFRYGADARGVLTWTFLDELRHYDEEIAVMAEAARVRIRFPSPYFRNMSTPIVIEGMEGEANWIKTVTVSYEEAFKQELRHFYGCVTGRTRPETDGHVGRQDIAVALDIYDAYARRVGLPMARRS
jgi:predicted dehydrogenase